MRKVFRHKWRLLVVAGLILIGLTLALAAIYTQTTKSSVAKPNQSVRSTAKSAVIRLATVTTVQTGGMLSQLLADFGQQTGYHVEVYAGEDVYDKARSGQADIVFSHLGHKDAQAFITDGLGQWPREVLLNTIALMIPPGDPAAVRGATDPVEAFRRIAQSRSLFIVNNIEGLSYLVDTLWNAAGQPNKEGWYSNTGLQKEDALQAAAAQGGYTLWGISPSLAAQQKQPLNLQPLILNDSLMQRIMVSVVVNPDKFPQTNTEGALGLQRYLLDPVTQAKIRNFRFAGIDQPIFWPAGRNNASALLK